MQNVQSIEGGSEIDIKSFKKELKGSDGKEKSSLGPEQLQTEQINELIQKLLTIKESRENQLQDQKVNVLKYPQKYASVPQEQKYHQELDQQTEGLDHNPQDIWIDEPFMTANGSSNEKIKKTENEQKIFDQLACLKVPKSQSTSEQDKPASQISKSPYFRRDDVSSDLRQLKLDQNSETRKCSTARKHEVSNQDMSIDKQGSQGQSKDMISKKDGAEKSPEVDSCGNVLVRVMSFQNSHRSKEPTGSNSDQQINLVSEENDNQKQNDLEARIQLRKQKIKQQASNTVVQLLEEEKKEDDGYNHSFIENNVMVNNQRPQIASFADGSFAQPQNVNEYNQRLETILSVERDNGEPQVQNVADLVDMEFNMPFNMHYDDEDMNSRTNMVVTPKLPFSLNHSKITEVNEDNIQSSIPQHAMQFGHSKNEASSDEEDFLSQQLNQFYNQSSINKNSVESMDQLGLQEIVMKLMHRIRTKEEKIKDLKHAQERSSLIMREMLEEREDREHRLNMLENELDHFQLAMEERDLLIGSLKEENEVILDKMVHEGSGNNDPNADETNTAKMQRIKSQINSASRHLQPLISSRHQQNQSRVTANTRLGDDQHSVDGTSVSISQFGYNQQANNINKIQSDLKHLRDEFQALGLLSQYESPRFQQERSVAAFNETHRDFNVSNQGDDLNNEFTSIELLNRSIFQNYHTSQNVLMAKKQRSAIRASAPGQFFGPLQNHNAEDLKPNFTSGNQSNISRQLQRHKKRMTQKSIVEKDKQMDGSFNGKFTSQQMGRKTFDNANQNLSLPRMNENSSFRKNEEDLWSINQNDQFKDGRGGHGYLNFRKLTSQNIKDKIKNDQFKSCGFQFQNTIDMQGQARTSRPGIHMTRNSVNSSQISQHVFQKQFEDNSPTIKSQINEKNSKFNEYDLSKDVQQDLVSINLVKQQSTAQLVQQDMTVFYPFLENLIKFNPAILDQPSGQYHLQRNQRNSQLAINMQESEQVENPSPFIPLQEGIFLHYAVKRVGFHFKFEPMLTIRSPLQNQYPHHDRQTSICRSSPIMKGRHQAGNSIGHDQNLQRRVRQNFQINIPHGIEEKPLDLVNPFQDMKRDFATTHDRINERVREHSMQQQINQPMQRRKPLSIFVEQINDEKSMFEES